MFPPLYAILNLNRGLAGAQSLAKKLADAGVKLIQLRDKDASSREIFNASLVLARQSGPVGVRFIVNDRADIAAMTGAGGVHVGQEDLPVAAAKRICGTDGWVGVSTHNLQQFKDALGTQADYIAVGPIFPTNTKANPDPVVGLNLLRAARGLTKKPIVAIGGITIESAESVFRAGADSLAVIQDLVAGNDPGKRAREYREIAERVMVGGR